MVFRLYKLYFLFPYTNPTHKPTPYSKVSAFLDFTKTKQNIQYVNYGDTGSVLLIHLYISNTYVIPIPPWLVSDRNQKHHNVMSNGLK